MHAAEHGNERASSPPAAAAAAAADPEAAAAAAADPAGRVCMCDRLPSKILWGFNRAMAEQRGGVGLMTACLVRQNACCNDCLRGLRLAISGKEV